MSPLVALLAVLGFCWAASALGAVGRYVLLSLLTQRRGR